MFPPSHMNVKAKQAGIREEGMIFNWDAASSLHETYGWGEKGEKSTVNDIHNTIFLNLSF